MTTIVPHWRSGLRLQWRVQSSKIQADEVSGRRSFRSLKLQVIGVLVRPKNLDPLRHENDRFVEVLDGPSVLESWINSDHWGLQVVLKGSQFRIFKASLQSRYESQHWEWILILIGSGCARWMHSRLATYSAWHYRRYQDDSLTSPSRWCLFLDGALKDTVKVALRIPFSFP